MLIIPEIKYIIIISIVVNLRSLSSRRASCDFSLRFSLSLSLSLYLELQRAMYLLLEK